METSKLHWLCFLTSTIVIGILTFETFILPTTVLKDVYRGLSFTTNRYYKRQSYQTTSVLTQSGKKIHLPDNIDIDIDGNAPILVEYTFLFHRPLSIQYGKGNKIYKVQVGMVNANSRTEFVIMLTLVFLIVSLFQRHLHRNGYLLASIFALLASISLFIFYLT